MTKLFGLGPFNW